MPYPKPMLIENFSELLQEEKTTETVVTMLKINSAHPLFDGHFPDNPITPGVLLMQLFKEQAERFTGQELQLAKASSVKFLSVIEPRVNAEVRLESQITTKGEMVELTGKALQEETLSLKLKLIFKPLL